MGVSDATVHYHFGSREALLEALLRDVGRRMKREFQDVIDNWDTESFDVRSLVSLLDDSYRRRGYGRLAGWMHLTGWRPRGSGMFRTHAEAIHAARLERARELGTPAPSVEDSLHLVVLLNLVMWADAVVGGEWRRSVGLPATAASARAFREWFASLTEDHLDAPPR
jgi:AcrR family transcriptional regulator